MALVDNKAKIQALLAGINALPEASSGEAPAPVLQEKAATPTKQAQSITPDEGYDGLSEVNVGAIPEEYIIPSGVVEITENGERDVREAESVNVNVPAPEITLQEKTVTPTESTQTVTPDSGYDGLSSVSVEAISDTYIGSKVPIQESQIITPGTSDQVIPPLRFLTGTQTIEGDENLMSENIKAGVSIFGIVGTLTAGGLPDGVVALATDTVTPATDETPVLEVTHNLGVVPDFLVWWDTTDYSAEVGTSLAYMGAVFEKQIKGSSAGTSIFNHSFSVHGYNANGAPNQTGSRATNTTRMTATTASLVCNTTYLIKAGHTYRWLCAKLST